MTRRFKQIDPACGQRVRIQRHAVEAFGVSGYRLAASLTHIAHDNRSFGVHIFSTLRAAQRQKFAKRIDEPFSLSIEAANAHDRCFS